MDTQLQAAITKQIDRLLVELDRRTVEHDRILPYFKRTSGDRSPIPPAVTAAKLTKAYTYLMGMSEATWGKLVVASKLDRLEVNGITSPDEAASLAVWEDVWQENDLNLDARLATRSALLDGRSHATVWPTGMWLNDEGGEFAGGSSDGPSVRFDDCTTMVVEYEDGSRSERAGALRRWVDDEGQEYVNLHRREAIYKFVRVKEADSGSDAFAAGGKRWKPREVTDEPWPLPNPLGIVCGVELGVNRELAPGRFTVCRGEFADETGLLDRVNLLTFLGMVLAVSMSFPLRILIGDVIRRDDDDNPLPPFEAYMGGVAHFEDINVKIAEFKAADRGALSIYGELSQFAAATSTPRHYFPSDGVIANVAAETIRAFEGPMHAAVRGSHQPSLGAGFEEVLRLGGLMLPSPVKLSRRARITWENHESRSIAEKASAFAQLGGEDGLPWEARAEIALGLGQDDIARYKQDHADSAFAQIIRAAQEPPPTKPASVPVPA